MNTELTYTIDGETFERFSSLAQDAVFHLHLAWQGQKLINKGDAFHIVTALGSPVEEDVKLDRLRYNARIISGHTAQLDLADTEERRYQIVMAELRATQGVKDITTPFFGVSRVEEPFMPLLEAFENALNYGLSLEEIEHFVDLNLEDHLEVRGMELESRLKQP
jgi:hypothetical protein